MREEAARAEVLGAALFVNVTVRVEDEARPTDAILVRVEHRDGRSYERIIPYVVGAGAVRLLEVTTSAREPTLLGLGLGSGGRAASGL